MTAKSASIYGSFAPLVQFYPKLSASIALGVMSMAVNSMKAFGSFGNKSAEPIEVTPLPSLPIPERVRSSRQPREKQLAARKSTTRPAARKSAKRPAAPKSTKRRSTRRRKAA